MIILPTKGRPQNLKRFVEAYGKTRATIPVSVVFDAADASQYSGIAVPDHWKLLVAKAGKPIGEIFNEFYTNNSFPFYGIVADDVVPETECWDIKLAAACLPNKLAWGNDSIQGSQLPTHPFIGAELLSRLGYIAAPGVKHWFVDNAWMIIAKTLCVDVYLPEIKMTHYHFINGKAPEDETYRQQPSHEADEQAFLEWRKGWMLNMKPMAA